MIASCSIDTKTGIVYNLQFMSKAYKCHLLKTRCNNLTHIYSKYIHKQMYTHNYSGASIHADLKCTLYFNTCYTTYTLADSWCALFRNMRFLSTRFGNLPVATYRTIARTLVADYYPIATHCFNPFHAAFS